MPRNVFFALVVFNLFASIVPAAANGIGDAGLPLGQMNYPYKSWNQPVRAALNMFGKNTNIAISIDEKINGSLSFDNDAPSSRIDYLNQVSELIGFTWYYDGYKLMVEDVSKYTTKNIPLDKFDSYTALNALRSMSFYQDKFLLEAVDEKSIIRVSGPESYVEAVANFLDSMESARPKQLIVVRGQRSSSIDDALGLIATETPSPNDRRSTGVVE